jgi:nucleotide-binding universal stress UspA family protein
VEGGSTGTLAESHVVVVSFPGEVFMQTLDAGAPIRFRNILLATDFSPSSDTALRYSLSIARRYGAKVYLANVVSTQASQAAINDAWRDAHTEITNQLIAGNLTGIKTQVLVSQGDVWDVLSSMIDEHHIDLLVVGTRGRTGVWKLLLGSTAERIFRQAPCPVLTVGPKTQPGALEKGPQRILFSTGFAQHSLNAGGFALSLAREQKATLGMLHVVAQTVESPEERQRLVTENKIRLRQLVPPDIGLACDPVLFVEFGSAAEAILKIATEWNPNVIVLGVRQPVGFARRVRWATAYEVVCKAPCPVLTVRMPFA